MTPERKTMTVEEFAYTVGIGKNNAYQLVREGRIPSVRLGRRLVIPANAFELMLEQKPTNHSHE